MVRPESVLNLIRSDTYSDMTTEELARHFSVGRAEEDAFVELLEELERAGEVVRVKDRHWVNPRRAGLVTGRLQCNPRGFGFVLPLEEEAEDVYVSEENMRDAMHGDLVVAEVQPAKSRGRGRRRRKDLGPSGRVIKVIEHRNHQVIGAFHAGRKFGRVVPENPALFRDIYVAREDWKGAREDDQVLVDLTVWPSLRRNPEGEVREVLGRIGDPALDVRSVILEFGLPREFPAEALSAAAEIVGTPSPQQLRARRDLRQHTTVTIDPEDAKDFDDALSFCRHPETGRPVVLVHIADISGHVPPDSPLDMEARVRGTSVYLANDVVPMFPHELSKDELSLVEGQDRPAKTVTIEYEEDGRMARYEICHSVVHVDRRMSYTEVQEVLDALDAEAPAAAAAAEKLPDEIAGLLSDLDGLAGRIRTLRREVGSVDLDVPEYEIGIGEDGRVVQVSQIVRDRSHGLVEEFMLSANRAVADFMVVNKLPALYRIHEPPVEEDLEEFRDFIATVLSRQIDPLDRKQLQQMLAEVSGTHVAEAVNMQLLRAMQRAVYSPACKPHFALHFDRYCHFTSPVRRYPDLLVHHVLDAFLKEERGAGDLRGQWRRKLAGIARHCNEMQERADEAEREIVKVKLLRYLQDHADQVFEGVVTGVQEYGLFVRLEDFSVEGLVKVQDIRDDFYRLDDRQKALVGTRTGRVLRLGQPLAVEVAKIDMSRRQLDLLLHE